MNITPRHWIRPLLFGSILMLPVAAAADDMTADREALRAKLDQARSELAEAARRLAQIQRQLVDEDGPGGRWQMTGLDGERDIEIILDQASEFQFIGSRPQLGILVGGEAGSNEVLGLTPGGGAEAAGMHRGDRVVEVNGIEIGVDTAIGQALEGVEAGDTVPVTVERNGERLSFDVTTSAPERDIRVFADIRVSSQRFAPDGNFEFDVETLGELPGAGEREIVVLRQGGAGGPDAPMPPLPHGAPRLPGLFVLGGDSDLVSNHDGLAPYFGTGEGVVVLRIGADNALNLVDGDVILRIDDEAVQRPVDLGRAMLGREPGETVLLEIMRNGTLQQIEGAVPESALPRLGRGLGLQIPAAAPHAAYPEHGRLGLAPKPAQPPRPPRPAPPAGLAVH